MNESLFSTIVVIQQAWSGSVLHARVIACTTSYLWKPGFSDSASFMYVLPSGPNVELRRFGFQSTHESSPPGAEILDQQIEPIRLAKGKLFLWYLCAAHQDRVTLKFSEPVNPPEPPYFITKEELTTPRVITLRGNVTSELAESPDVLAHVAWDETKVSRDRYDDVLKCGQPERGLAYPRGLWLPGKIMTDVAESTCVYKLPADHNDFVEIFLMDGGINMDQSCRLIRQAMRHDGQLLSAEIGRFPKGSVLK